MSVAASTQEIQAVIRALYEEAEAEPPSLPQTIVPLAELLGAYSLVAHEMEGLTAALACAELDLPPEAAGETPLNEPLAGFLLVSPAPGLICRGTMFISRGGHNRIPRRRFTAAHELGHFLLHFRPAFRRAAEEGLDLMDLVETAPQPPKEDEEERPTGSVRLEGADRDMLLPPLEQMEDEADRYAAELLMPEPLVRALAEKYATICRGPDMARRLSAEMLVSESAMHKRLRDLRLTDAPAPDRE